MPDMGEMNTRDRQEEENWNTNRTIDSTENSETQMMENINVSRSSW